MPSQYDKLGEMLKAAIESGNIPKPEKKSRTEEHSATESSFSKKSSKKSTQESIKKSTKNNLSVQKYIHLFKLFNLNSDCTKEELKSAYHSLLKKYHPDNIKPGFPEMQKTAAKKTQELVEAYNLLINLIG